MLVTGVFAIGVAALCVLGVRHGADASSAERIFRLFAAVIAALGAPVAMAAAAPAGGSLRILYLVVAGLICAAVDAASWGLLTTVSPPRLLAGAATGLFVFLIALSPLTRNAVRLGAAAPFATLLGLAGGAGFLALENLLADPFMPAAAAIALGAGVSIGIGVGADYARQFARGLSPVAAAAAAGHAAIAPAVFSILAAASFVVIVTLKANFGAVDWLAFAGAAVFSVLVIAGALICVTASLALARPSEQVAVDENRRRQRFNESWRWFRKRLPAPTAVAASAVAGVMLVVALFEAGVAEAFSLFLFLFLIIVAAGAAFVSVRTCLLIGVILFMSAVFAGYVYAVFGLTVPAMPERFAALSLAAIALSQLTVSWRNAGDIWRNARDIAQNAMSDGLRRFAIAIGAGAASLMTAAYAFSWDSGVASASYFAILSGLSLVLAPVGMVAMSAQAQRV